MKLCDPTLCTGCGACVLSCPRKAIEFQDGAMGFRYPKVLNENCINCNRCEQVCPILRNPQWSAPSHVYAAFSKDTALRAASASGGIATALGKSMIQNGSVVFGVQQSDGIHTVYSSASTIDELSRFQNSKYVESALGTTYDDVKALLKKGKSVLFIGLPCHVAGLRNYIADALQQKLYVVDVICHGTPSAAFFAECIKREYGDNARVRSFRSENAQFFLTVQKNRNENAYPPPADLYFNSFAESYSYRESCYHCQFAQEKRVADLTIGDFWGLGTEIPYPYNPNKVSLVLQNTEKGEELLQRIKNDVQIDERTLEEAVKQNAQLRHASEKSEAAFKFQTYCQQMSPYQAAVKLTGRAVKYQKIRWALSCIKRRLTKQR